MKIATEITIRNYHVDHFGHVNHARYIELLEEARWRYLEEMQLLAPIHLVGAFHIVSEIRIQYRHPAKMGDILRIETTIKKKSKHRFWVEQIAFDKASEKIIIEAIITNVFINKHGRPRIIDQRILDIWPDLAQATWCAEIVN